MVNNWSKNALSILLPDRCLLCGAPGPDCRGLALCSGCLTDLPWLNRCCRKCALPIPTNARIPSLCGQCQKNPPPFGRSLCLFHYDYPVDRLVTGLKFRHKLIYGRLFGQLLANSIRFSYRDHPIPDAVIPVPLHHSRLRERGFNQAHEIARLCATELCRPLLWQACRRIHPTPHQIGLDAPTRRRNLKNAFWINKNLTLSSVALVDDVMTTGSTLAELACALKRAGVQTVHNWCIARTVPKPG